MKKIFFIFCIFFVFLHFPLFAHEADTLFMERNTDEKGLENAKKAGVLFLSMAESTSDTILKAEYLIQAASANYFCGDNVQDQTMKMNFFLAGSQNAKKGADLLAQNSAKKSPPRDPKQKERLARAYYWFAANKGRWGELSGALDAIKEWQIVQEYLLYIINDLKEPQVDYYGPHRILGAAYMRLPTLLGGSNSLAYDYLSTAFDKTSVEDINGISNCAANCLYYAKILDIYGGEKRKLAKSILETLISLAESNQSLHDYNSQRIPENKKEIEEAKTVLEHIK